MPNRDASDRPFDILVVEDNADDLEMFLLALRKVQSDLEIEVKAHTLSNGAEAAAIVKDRKFDAIFLDINLPPPDGVELAKQIRSSAINRATPVVILTGAAERGLLTRAFEAGANMFLFKPIDRRQLSRLMQVASVPIGRERRRLQRVKLKCKVSIAIESGKDRLEGETLDVSLGGMFIRASSILPVGSVVNVTLTLPQSPVPIRTAARIVRVVGNDCMGIRLENVGRAESDRLGEFLIPLLVASTEGTTKRAT